MDLNDIDDDTLDQLADRLAERLDPGAYGDRVVLSRRQLVGVATGVLGTGTLLSLGVDPAAAQAAGSVGTSSDPVDVTAYDLDVANGVSMNGTDITNAGSVSTDVVSITNAGDIYQSGDFLDVFSFGFTERLDDTSSTTFTGIGEINGFVPNSDRPAGASLYGRLSARFGNFTSGETTTLRPTVVESGRAFPVLSELEITNTGSEAVVDSGWIKITSTDANWFICDSMEGKVTGGTADVREAGLAFGWRIE